MVFVEQDIKLLIHLRRLYLMSSDFLMFLPEFLWKKPIILLLFCVETRAIKDLPQYSRCLVAFVYVNNWI